MSALQVVLTGSPQHVKVAQHWSLRTHPVSPDMGRAQYEHTVCEMWRSRRFFLVNLSLFRHSAQNASFVRLTHKQAEKIEKEVEALVSHAIDVWSPMSDQRLHSFVPTALLMHTWVKALQDWAQVDHMCLLSYVEQKSLLKILKCLKVSLQSSNQSQLEKIFVRAHAFSGCLTSPVT